MNLFICGDSFVQEYVRKVLTLLTNFVIAFKSEANMMKQPLDVIVGKLKSFPASAENDAAIDYAKKVFSIVNIHM